MFVRSAPRNEADYSSFPASTIRRQLHRRVGYFHSIDSSLSRSLLCRTNQRPEAGAILLDFGPSVLRRTAEDSQFLSRSNKVRERPCSHLLHNVTAMNLDSFFGC